MGKGQRETILEWCTRNGEIGKRMYDGMMRVEQENLNEGIYIDSYYPQTQKVHMKCENGHDMYYKIQSIRQGAWCRQCRMIEANRERFEKEVSNGQRQSLYEWCQSNGIKGKMILEGFERRKAENEADGLDLKKIAANSNRTKLHLMCDYGHDFDNYVYQVTAHDGWCPYCAVSGTGVRLKEARLERNGSFYDWIISQGDYGQRVLEAFNRCKELNKDIDLTKLSYCAKADKIWLSCSNPTHKPWQTNTADVVRKRWCPYCSHQTSFPEQVLYNWCLDNFGDTKNRAKISHDGITKEADIYIPSLNLLIEYQGQYYHQNRMEHDKFKVDFFKKHGYKYLQIFESKDQDSVILPDGNLRHNCFKDNSCVVLIKSLSTWFKLQGIQLKCDTLTPVQVQKARLFMNN